MCWIPSVPLEGVKDMHHQHPPCVSHLQNHPSSSGHLRPSHDGVAYPDLGGPDVQVGGQKVLCLREGIKFLLIHLPPSSIVVAALNSCSRQNHSRATPYDRDWKRLYLFGKKVYSSATLQLRITNYQALIVKYDYTNYNKLNNFIDKLLETFQDSFKAIIQEGQFVAKTSLQSALDVVNMVVRTISMTVMSPTLGIPEGGIPRDS